MRWTIQYSYISSNEQRRDDFRERVVRHKILNNYLHVIITLFLYYLMYYVMRIVILCPYDNYLQSYTIRKLLLISANDDANDGNYLATLYST